MAEIRAFRGIRFSAASHGRDLGDYLSPPFDVITPSIQSELLSRSQHNIVRLELAPLNGEDRYGYVAEVQQQWMREGVLIRDDKPSLYVTEETFSYGGEFQTRRGFIAAVRLEEYDRGIIFPHERTRDSWVEDRVSMMRASKSVLSPLLMVFQDDIRRSVGGMIRAVAGGAPTETATMSGGHSMRLWQVTDPGSISVIHSLMRESQLFIADGHHRYEAAMRHRSSIRTHREISPDESINFRMMHLVSIDEPGLITRGYHRVISGASSDELDAITSLICEVCDVESWDGDVDGSDMSDVLERFVTDLGSRNGDDTVFGLYGAFGNRGFHVAHMRSDVLSGEKEENALDRSEYMRLHRMILDVALGETRSDDVVDFEHDLESVVSKVDNKEAQMGIVMRSVPLPEFVDIVSRGLRLPPKATNFYPKPPAGAVIQSLEGSL